MFASLFYASVALIGAAADDQPQELSIGDPAPKLQIREFVQGEPIKEFESGKTYVVEFWATWCAPCRESIPHLTALQKKYKNVAFLGVSVDEDAKLVKPFVTKMGAKMDYRVAIEARDGDAGKMGQTWMDASYQSGIPTTFIVNSDGKVAWIGHPKDLEKPLKEILAGKWDLAAKAAEFKEAIAEEKQQAAAEKSARKLADRLARAVKDKRYDDVLKIVDEAEDKQIELHEYEVGPQVVRLAALVISGTNSTKAVALAKDLLAESDGFAGPVLVAIVDPQRTLDRDWGSRSDGLHFLAPPKIEHRLAALAAKAADKMAADYEKEHSSIPLCIADDRLLLAAAYQAAGQNEKAVREYKKAEAALEAVVKQANDALEKSRAMEKELGETKE